MFLIMQLYLKYATFMHFPEDMKKLPFAYMNNDIFNQNYYLVVYIVYIFYAFAYKSGP